MDKIKKYTLKNGKVKWKFRLYAGVNPKTGKQEYINRQGYDTQREAKIEMNRLQVQIDEGTYFTKQKENKTYTYKEVYEKWLKEYKQTVAASTLLKTKGDFERRILPAIGHFKIREITHDDIQRLANEWGKYQKCRLWISTLGRIFEYAQVHNFTETDPSKLVTIPKYKKTNDKKYFYEKEELNKFLHSLKQEDDLQKVALLRLLIFTGMRRGEVIALYWDCIDFKDKTVTVKRSLRRREKTKDDGSKSKTEVYIGEPKNESSYREIPVDDETMKVLLKLREFKFNERVFNGSTGNILSPSKPREWLHVVVKKAKIEPINVHGLRHTYASLLIDLGASPKEIQHYLGHSKIETTLKVYTHLTNKSKRDFSNKFSEYVSGTEQNTEQEKEKPTNIVDLTAFM